MELLCLPCFGRSWRLWGSFLELRRAFFFNLRRPGAQNGSRWNFGRLPRPAVLKFLTAFATFCIFWDLAGRQKLTKNRSLAPNGVPGGEVLSIRVAEIVVLTFGLDFSSIFDENLMQKSMHLFKAARDLFNLSTL